MSKKIIGIIVGVIVIALALFFIITSKERVVVENGENNNLQNEETVVSGIDDLTEEEFTQLNDKYLEVVPDDMFNEDGEIDEKYIEIDGIMKTKVMQMTSEELRDLAISDIERMWQETLLELE